MNAPLSFVSAWRRTRSYRFSRTTVAPICAIPAGLRTSPAMLPVRRAGLAAVARGARLKSPATQTAAILGPPFVTRPLF